jgi:peptidoglycan/xylan/chitin deacetylase (PgdA/CDA1 family)
MKHKALFSLSVIIYLLLFANDDARTAGSLDDRSVYLPIIMYHEVKTYKLGKDVISPWEFESDLKYLRENKFTAITIDDLLGYVYGENDLPEKPIMLTFDDGYLNNYINVYPLLKKYNMKIVMSIIVKDTDDFTDTPSNNADYSHVTWEQLTEMIDSGCVEVQNHTYDLHYMRNGRTGCFQSRNETYEKYEEFVTEDIRRAQDEITQHTGAKPNAFSYPYGQYGDDIDSILKKLGFSATFTCDYGINIISKQDMSLYNLKRISRFHNYNIGRLLKDGYETVHIRR